MGEPMNDPRANVARGSAETAEPGSGELDDPLLDCLAIVTRLHGRPISPQALAAGLPLENHRLTPLLFVRAAENHGFSARVVKRALKRISNLVLPVVLLLKDGGACVLTRLDPKDTAQLIFPESGTGAKTVPIAELQPLYTGYCLFAHPRPRPDQRMEEVSQPSSFWFWGTFWRFKRYYVETVVASLLVNVLTLATSLFTMNVYDRVVPNNAFTTLWVLAMGTALAIGFEFTMRVLRGYFIDLSGKKADLILASTLFRQAMGISMASRPASAGGFASNLRESEALRDFFTSATLTTLTDLPFVFLFTWVVSLIAGPLAFVPLAAIPVLLVAGLIAQIPLASTMRRHLHESALKHGVLVEAVEGLETVKSLSAEGIMQGRWENYTALTAASALTSRFISSLVVNFSLLVQQISIVALVVWGAYRIGMGELTTGGLVASTILTSRALGSLAQVSGLLARYQHARAALKTLNRIMRLPVERPAERTFLHRPVLSGEVELAGVSFSYPEQQIPALKDISFRVQAGERVAILGKVGAGKSTLLKLVMGFYHPDSGSVLLDGLDLRQIDPADLRRNAGYVSQDVRLFFGTLRENIVMGAPLADDEAILKVSRIAGLEALVARHPLGFDLPVGERGENLSGGQKQAVAIARALLACPPILLLDEPTSSMDHATEQAFIHHLKAFAQGKTVILATHKPALLELVDRLIVLDGGRVAADGPRDLVLKALTRQAAPGAGVSA